VGQADGLRQRQPKRAADDEGFADMGRIMAGIGQVVCLAMLNKLSCKLLILLDIFE
jgi:hypothetical protein